MNIEYRPLRRSLVHRVPAVQNNDQSNILLNPFDIVSQQARPFWRQQTNHDSLRRSGKDFAHVQYVYTGFLGL